MQVAGIPSGVRAAVADPARTAGARIEAPGPLDTLSPMEVVVLVPYRFARLRGTRRRCYMLAARSVLVPVRQADRSHSLRARSASRAFLGASITSG